MLTNKTLSICIPTYNRASYLDICLQKIAVEVKGFEQFVELIISDNASTDNTSDIVSKYCSLGLDIKYYKQDSNVGTERNFLSLYERAESEYFWLLSDDDYPVSGTLQSILHLVEKARFGIIYLSNAWYTDEPVSVDSVSINNYTIYNNPLDFIERTNYWITFISGNIINKTAINGKINPSEFNGTMLNYLGWFIPAIFQGYDNVVIEDVCLICKSGNTGGYKLIKVFGENFNFVMDKLIAKGYDSKMKNIINNHLICSFFPMFLNVSNDKFIKEKYLSSMIRVFWKYKNFWKVIFPMLVKKHLNIK
jgi:abequosyltransferase